MKRTLLLLIALCIVDMASAERHSIVEIDDRPDYYSCSIIESTTNKLIIDFKMHHYEMVTVEMMGNKYSHIQLPSQGTTSEIGNPELPLVNQMIVVPNGKKAIVRITGEQWANETTGHPLYPHQKMLKDGDDDTNEFVLNENVYGSNIVYQRKTVELLSPQRMRGIYNMILSICPFKFITEENTLCCLTAATIEVSFVTDSMDDSPIGYKSQNDFSDLFINSNILDEQSEFMQSDKKNRQETDYEYDYLILTPSAYIGTDALRAFVDWKSRMGHTCKVVSTNVSGTTDTAIKNYIASQYQNYGISYVLLIGNAANIPQHNQYITNEGYVRSDYWYGCLDGNNDYQPEVSVGRFCVSNKQELENVIYKSINYEKSPVNGSWLYKSLLIAHKENAPYKYQACSEMIRTNNYVEFPSFVKAYGASASVGGTNATNQTIIDAINNGIGIVNYRGHGDVSEWIASWNLQYAAFDSTSICQLTNTENHPIVFSIACSTSDIYSGEKSLSEKFITGRTGAVAYLGATIPSYTSINDTFDERLFQLLYRGVSDDISSINNSAQLQTISAYSASSPSIYNCFAYWWNGDPSLVPYTSSLNTLSNVTHNYSSGNLSISLGSNTNCEIIVTSVLDDGKSFNERRTNVTGTQNFYSVPHPYYMTVKKHNYKTKLFDTNIQNVTISDNIYVSGDNIHIGSNVTTDHNCGNVYFSASSNALLCPTNQLIMEEGTYCRLGSKVKTIKTTVQ